MCQFLAKMGLTKGRCNACGKPHPWTTKPTALASRWHKSRSDYCLNRPETPSVYIKLEPLLSVPLLPIFYHLGLSSGTCGSCIRLDPSIDLCSLTVTPWSSGWNFPHGYVLQMEEASPQCIFHVALFLTTMTCILLSVCSCHMLLLSNAFIAHRVGKLNGNS